MDTIFIIIALATPLALTVWIARITWKNKKLHFILRMCILIFLLLAYGLINGCSQGMIKRAYNFTETSTK